VFFPSRARRPVLPAAAARSARVTRSMHFVRARYAAGFSPSSGHTRFPFMLVLPQATNRGSSRGTAALENWRERAAWATLSKTVEQDAQTCRSSSGGRNREVHHSRFFRLAIVVGADGARSKVRQRPPRSILWAIRRGHMMMLGDVVLDAPPSSSDGHGCETRRAACLSCRSVDGPSPQDRLDGCVRRISPAPFEPLPAR